MLTCRIVNEYLNLVKINFPKFYFNFIPNIFYCSPFKPSMTTRAQKKKRIQDSPSWKITPSWSSFVIIPFISDIPSPSLLGFPQKEKKRRENPPASSSMVYFEKSFRESRCLDKPESRTGACSHLSGLAFHPAKIAKWCFSFRRPRLQKSDTFGLKWSIVSLCMRARCKYPRFPPPPSVHT